MRGSFYVSYISSFGISGIKIQSSCRRYCSQTFRLPGNYYHYHWETLKQFEIFTRAKEIHYLHGEEPSALRSTERVERVDGNTL